MYNKFCLYLQHMGTMLNSKAFAKTCFIVALFSIVVQICFCNSQHLWLDPALSLCIIDNSYIDMIDVTANDVHPPLYYIILKTFIDIALDIKPDLSVITLAKLVSVIPFIIIYILCGTVIRKTWNNNIPGLTCLAALCMPGLIQLGTEARMYSWATLFIFTCYVYAYKSLQEEKFLNWAIFAISGLCAAYTHTYACIAVIPIYIYVGYQCIKTRKGILLWLSSSLLAVVAFSPWLFILIEQTQRISENYWIKPISLQDAASYFMAPFTIPFSQFRYTFAFFCIMIITITIILNRHRQRPDGFSICAISSYLFTLLVGLIASYCIRPVFVSRYMEPAYATMWFGLILLCSSARMQQAKTLITLFICTVSLLNLCRYVSDHKRKEESTQLLLSTIQDTHTNTIVCDSLSVALPISFQIESNIYILELGAEQKKWIDTTKQVNYITSISGLKKVINPKHRALIIASAEEKNIAIKAMETLKYNIKYYASVGSVHVWVVVVSNTDKGSLKT